MKEDFAEEKAEKKSTSEKWAIGITIVGGTVFTAALIWFGFSVSFGWWHKLSPDLVAKAGDFVGGIVGSLWALAGVIMFYSALQDQRLDFKTNRKILSAQLEEFKLQQQELFETRKVFKDQSETLRIQRFESSFFNMLESLNRMVESYKITEGSTVTRNLSVYEGYEVFKKVHKEIEDTASFSFETKSHREDFVELFKADINAQISVRYEICLTFFKIVEQIIFLIDEGNPVDNRARYVDLLKAHLNPFQFSVLGYFLLSTDLEIGKVLTIIKALKLFDNQSFELMSNISISMELLEITINEAKWEVN